MSSMLRLRCSAKTARLRIGLRLTHGDIGFQLGDGALAFLERQQVLLGVDQIRNVVFSVPPNSALRTE